MRNILDNHDNFKIIKSIIKKDLSCEEVLICGLTIYGSDSDLTFASYLETLFPEFHTNIINQLAQGLYSFCLIPVLFSLYCHDTPFETLDYLLKSNDSFVATTFSLIKNTSVYSPNDLYVFEKLLVSLHAGFGVVAPSIILPRFSASTQAHIGLNIIAGFTASGAAHVGACKDAMRSYAFLLHNSIDLNEYVDDMIQNKGIVPGFGHPLLNIDPRNSVLEKIGIHNLSGTKNINFYLVLKKLLFKKLRLNPNVDSISASILLDLGTPETLGTSIFLFSRVPSMITHAIQKKLKPAFGFNKKESRQRFDKVPLDWL